MYFVRSAEILLTRSASIATPDGITSCTFSGTMDCVAVILLVGACCVAVCDSAGVARIVSARLPFGFSGLTGWCFVSLFTFGFSGLTGWYSVFGGPGGSAVVW